MQVAWIETFLTVVERRGFCAAADSLFRSQSRVSAHIASLELELGAQLFDRSQRPVALTAAGHVFFEYATSAKSSLDAGAAAVRAVHQHDTHRVTLGVSPGTGAAFLPALLARVACERPDLRVEIVERPASELDRALLDGTVDVAIRTRLPRLVPSSITREALWFERMVVVLPRDHPLVSAPAVHLADLNGESLITNDEAVAMLCAVNFNPNVSVVSDHPSTLVGFVNRGLGIGLTNGLALDSVATEGVVVVELADAIHRVVEICCLGDVDERSRARVLLDEIRQARVPARGARSTRGAERALRLVEPDVDAPSAPPNRRATVWEPHARETRSARAAARAGLGLTL